MLLCLELLMCQFKGNSNAKLRRPPGHLVRVAYGEEGIVMSV